MKPVFNALFPCFRIETSEEKDSFLKGFVSGLIKKALRKLGLQGVKKKNRCY
jgi:hypothetical protein